MKNALTDTARSSCIMCGGDSFTESVESESFPFGADEDIITVNVPVNTCVECDFSFTDFRAEEIRHDAACEHQNLLTPDRIREIRAVYGMNRRDFAAAFRIGHASLERWENRKLFISGQSSFYLLALENKEVGLSLLSIANEPAKTKDESNVIHVDFSALSASSERYEKALKRRDLFSLKRNNG
ncbi:hypothetical protein [Sphingomonas sp. PP-CE-1A-559]|uniref:hypothetical protein n=1 Tax=Sphingomonas sp. PP-CE-1A-559 TaxID=2135657 RepID=UPI0010554FB0|nr:hypothetical protein [Sphingomonas sp. PP-CE-1A-559]